jgi:hypothetical protein
MVPGNFESLEDKCLLGSNFQNCVRNISGFMWINEAKEAPRPKWGYIALDPEAYIDMETNTMATSRAMPEAQQQEGQQEGQQQQQEEKKEEEEAPKVHG